MDRNEIKDFIVEKTLEGMAMTAIQDALAEAGVKIKFMELRLLAAECDAVLEKKRQEKAAAEAKAAAANAEKTAAAAPAPAAAEAETAEETVKPRGETTVTVSPIQRPGYLACGMVTFGTGGTAEWFLDQSGQLALDNLKGPEPDRQDQQEFVRELKKVLGGAGA